MGKLKKWKSRVLVIATLFCMMAMMMPGSAVAAGTFTDTSGHWGKDTIESWVGQGFVSGYPDDTFKPDKNITRAEFMTLVNKAFGFTETESINYSDVEPGAWYQKTIAVAKAAGYISGDPAGTIRPDDPISREEAASIIMRLKNLDPDQEAVSQFTDAVKITWSKGAVGAVAGAGIMQGYPDGTFQPQRFITRAEAIAALDGAVNYRVVKPETPAPVTPDAPKVTGNDTTNTVSGMKIGMEYKLDGEDWVEYDADDYEDLDLNGDHTLLVRYAAEGNNPCSPLVKLIFTENSKFSGGGGVTLYISVTEITTPDSTTVTFSSDVAGAAITWNGTLLTGVTTVIGENTITVPPMTSAEPNTLRVKKSNYKGFTDSDVIWYAAPVISNVKISSNNEKSQTIAWNGDIITLTFTANEPVEKLSNFKINGSNPDTFTSDGNNNYTATHLVDAGDLVTGQPITFQINVVNEHGKYSQTIEATTDGSSVMIIGLAELVPTGTAGVKDGKAYAGYKFMFGEEQFSLAADNISLIVVLEPGQTIGQSLTPDSDPLLWFNVEKAAGEYLYAVQTIDSKPYMAKFNWAGLQTATLAPTGAAGEHEGINYAEHQMLNGKSQAISLAEGAVSLIAQRDLAGDWVALEPNTDTTLWFNQARPTFNYDFIVVNAQGVYHATLDWIVYVDQVVNGGFETGNFEGWLVHRGGIFPQVQSGTIYEGDYASFMGDGGEGLSIGGGTASIAQYLSIADNDSTPYLDLNYRVVGTDTWGENYDWMKVFINDNQIAYWWSDTAGWQDFSYDLSAYKGQDIELKIVSWTSDGQYAANYYVDNISLYYEAPDVEITGFVPMNNVDGGTAGAATYSDAAAVIAYLNTNITEVTITGTTDTVPVSDWTDTDGYAPAEGSYTFTATVGDLPEGYIDVVEPVTTVTVEVMVEAPLPIILTADTTLNDVDHEIDITFEAGAAYANAITGVSFNGTALTVTTDYVVSSDKVTLKPAGGNTMLRTPATADVVIKATSYGDSSVSQTITAGAANNIEVTIEPIPGANNQLFATQPEITIYDQYDNICADGPSADAIIYADSGNPNLWVMHGTHSVNATKGVATYNDLVCLASSPGDGEIIFDLRDTNYNILYTLYFFFTLPDIEITGFDAIPDVDAGTAGAATYANAAAVQAILPANVKANSNKVTVPVTSWADTDTYDPNVAGSYTFTATVGTLPHGYIDAADPITTVTVEVVISAAPPLSADASLTELKYFLGTWTNVPGFASDTLSYDITLPEGTTQTPGISCARSHINASVQVNHTFSLPGTTTIVVTAADGTTTKTYSLNFTVAAADSTVPAAASYDLYTDTTLGISMTLNGNTLTNINDGSADLVSGTDYTLDGSTVTLTEDYMQAQSVGDLTLTFTFSAGAADSTVITVSDSAPKPRLYLTDGSTNELDESLWDADWQLLGSNYDGLEMAYPYFVMKEGSGEITNVDAQLTGTNPEAFEIILGGELYEYDYPWLTTFDDSNYFNWFKVHPKDGMPSGTYNATVLVSGDNGTESGTSLSFNIKFRVS